MPVPVGGGGLPAVEPGSVTSAAGADALFDRYPMYAAGLEWLRRFVVRPHPELRRRGAVCPRLGHALRADLVWLVAIRTGGSAATDAAAAGRLLAAAFHAQVGGDAARFQAGALLAFFPDVPAGAAQDFIDGGHRLLRRQFVAAGLMLGEFHPRSTVGSAHNPDLAVMRSPVPMFAVRALSVHDLLFLDDPKAPPARRLMYLELYRRHLGPQLSAAATADLDARIAARRAAAALDATLLCAASSPATPAGAIRAGEVQ